MKRNYGRMAALGLFVMLVFTAVVARPALAASDDIVLGMFFRSDKNLTNDIYASYNGTSFTRISSFYGSNYKDSNGGSHWGHSDPSIMYYKGKFWALSNWNRYDGKFWPMISYSTDLVHWTHPEGEGLLNGTRGVQLNAWPSGFSSSNKGFDVVAPEWFVSKNGSVYIVFSAGFYGGFHGRPMEDRMQAYMVKVSALSAGAGYTDGNTKYLWPNNLTFKAGKAYRLNIPGNSASNANYIDGALYNDNGKDYLVIKKGGLTNQLFTTSNIDSNSWSMVNSKVSYSYEGASIAKLGSSYFMVADHVTGATADGVRVFKSSSITNKSQWSLQGSSFATKAGANCTVRHGSILCLKSGTDGWKAAKKLLGEQKKSAHGLYYTTHVQRDGWQDWRLEGTMAGTSGRSLRLEGIKIKLDGAPYSGGIRYKTHVQREGWQGWKSNGAMSGTSGKSLRLEAIQIELTGTMKQKFDVYYRVHAQNFGWMGWAKNGAQAGTAGYSYRLEGIQIVLVKKGGSAPPATYNGLKRNTTAAFRKR